MSELNILNKLTVVPTNPFTSSTRTDETDQLTSANNVNNEISPTSLTVQRAIFQFPSIDPSLPFNQRPRTLTNLDDMDGDKSFSIIRTVSPKLGEKRKPGRPKKEEIDLLELLNIPRKNPTSKNFCSIRADNIIGPQKRGRGRPRKDKDPIIFKDGESSKIVPQVSREATSTAEPRASLITKAAMKWAIVECDEKDVIVQSARLDDKFDSDDDAPEYNSDDSSTDWKPKTKGMGKRGRPRLASNTIIKTESTGPKQRGRPRKYPPKDPNEPKRPRGRPRKEAMLIDGAPVSLTVKTEYREGTPTPIKRPKIEPKPKEIPGIVEFKYDDDIEDDLTKFVFVKGENEEVKKGPGRPKISAIEKQKQIIRTDVFASPKKQKLGSITLSATPSPSKKGILNMVGSSPTKSPNGRAGSPRRMKQQLQDRSARKKATRVLYSQLMDVDIEDDDEFEEEKKLAERIIEESQKSVTSPFTSPRKNQVSLPTLKSDFVPTPLPTTKEEELFFDSKYDDKALFLDGPEGYFDQHRTKVKTSNNSMVQAPQLEHDEFNSLVSISGFLHHKEKAILEMTYKKMYNQWWFQLDQGFSLAFFGIGSKRKLLLDYCEDFLSNIVDAPIMVLNGYNPATGIKELLLAIVSTLELKKIPTRVGDLVDFIVDYYKEKGNKIRLILLVHNIDGQSLRDEKTQIYFSKLASIKQFYFITSIDHINAPLLWDSTMLSNFNFVWHNTTTFSDYILETSFVDILTLGQTQKSAGSKGAKYVLSSLTANSKSLYRVLVSNQLQNMEDDLSTKKAHNDNQMKGTIKHALEYRNFFTLCAEEFISSNEINFRTMLMEFVEHKMAILTKDQAGTEYVFIPFSLEELHKLLEDELL